MLIQESPENKKYYYAVWLIESLGGLWSIDCPSWRIESNVLWIYLTQEHSNKYEADYIIPLDNIRGIIKRCS